jgi:cholesterol oxidase
MDGVPLSSLSEVLLNRPATAHILGGCIMGKSPDEGVIDDTQKVFGYRNLMICDGSVVPANLGVNPALSILALSERAMSLIPPKAT